MHVGANVQPVAQVHRVLEHLSRNIEFRLWKHPKLFEIAENVWGPIHEAKKLRVSRVLSINRGQKEQIGSFH